MWVSRCPSSVVSTAERDRRLSGLLIALLILGAGLSVLALPHLPPDTTAPADPTPLADPSPSAAVGRSTSGSLIDAPGWRIGDRWVHATMLDVAGFIQLANLSGASTSPLTGDTDVEVMSVFTQTVEGHSSVVYRRNSSGAYQTSALGATLPVNNVSVMGQLKVDLEQSDVVRASDLATVHTFAELDILFCPWGWCLFSEIEVATLEIETSADPPEEVWDFPLDVGQTWRTSAHRTIRWNGSSDTVDLPLEETTETVNTTLVHEAVSLGTPPGINYLGCAGSVNVTSAPMVNGTNATGNVTGQADLANATAWRWWCPEARDSALTHTALMEGVLLEQRLKLVLPNASTGVDSTRDTGVRSVRLSVELDPPATPRSSHVGAWVNVSDGSGPVANATGNLRHERLDAVHNWTTAANGSAWVSFATGDVGDMSPDADDDGSHGIVAWQILERRIAVATLVLDDDIIEHDLVVREAAAAIGRTRDGTRVALAGVPPTRFDFIPGDVIHLSLPVANEGIRTSPAVSVQVRWPDDVTSAITLAGLRARTTGRVEVRWTVQADAAVGPITFGWWADAADVYAEGNESNNHGNVTVRVGRLPLASIAEPDSPITGEEIILDGLASSDPDGGGVLCGWEVEYGPADPAPRGVVAPGTCSLALNWTQDGAYRVNLTVIDDEGDSGVAQVTVTVRNQAPWVDLIANRTTLPVEGRVHLDARGSVDNDTEHPLDPLTALWLGVPCVEQPSVLECVVEPLAEGVVTVGVTLTDDDGQWATVMLDLLSLNVAPIGVGMGATLDGSSVPVDGLGVWSLLEDQMIELEAWANDTRSDAGRLSFSWALDAVHDPGGTVNGTAVVEAQWTESGLHTIIVEAIDDDGAHSEALTRWARVSNVEPTMAPLAGAVIAEDEVVELEAVVNDTASDRGSLVTCWDIDPLVDADGANRSDDDCDVRGTSLAMSWPTSGSRTLRVWVTDDDGAEAERSVVIDVRNRAPRAMVEQVTPSAAAGTPVTFSAAGSEDTATDTPSLSYSWDFDTGVDADGDGDATNDEDASGIEVQHTFVAGSFGVRLTVRDEAAFGVADLIVNVSEAPPSGLLGFLGGGGEGVALLMLVLGVALLGLLGLVVYLVLRPAVPRGPPRPSAWLEHGPLAVAEPHAVSDAPPPPSAPLPADPCAGVELSLLAEPAPVAAPAPVPSDLWGDLGATAPPAAPVPAVQPNPAETTRLFAALLETSPAEPAMPGPAPVTQAVTLPESATPTPGAEPPDTDAALDL